MFYHIIYHIVCYYIVLYHAISNHIILYIIYWYYFLYIISYHIISYYAILFQFLLKYILCIFINCVYICIWFLLIIVFWFERMGDCKSMQKPCLIILIYPVWIFGDRSRFLTNRSHEVTVEVFRDLPWILPSRPSQRSVIEGAQENTCQRCFITNPSMDCPLRWKNGIVKGPPSNSSFVEYVFYHFYPCSTISVGLTLPSLGPSTATGSKFIDHDLKRSLQGVCLWSKWLASV